VGTSLHFAIIVRAKKNNNTTFIIATQTNLPVRAGEEIAQQVLN